MVFWRKNKTGKGLKYLFVAEFADGSIIQQTPEDVSKIDPQRSDFYDVLQFTDPLVRFSLQKWGFRASIDLTTGIFTVNGSSFLVDEGEREMEPKPLQVVFFRRHQELVQIGEAGIEGESSAPVRYFIGWHSKREGARQFTINFE